MKRLLIPLMAAMLAAAACRGDDTSADPTVASRPIFAVVDVFAALAGDGIGCARTTQANPAGLDQARAEVPFLAGLTGAGSCSYPPADRPDLPSDSLSIATFTGERGRLIFSLPSFESSCADLQADELSYVYGENWTLWGTQRGGSGVMPEVAAATGGAVGTADCNRLEFARRALCPSPFADVSTCDPSAAEDDFFRAALGEPTTVPDASSPRDALLGYFQTGVLTGVLADPGPESRFEYEGPGPGFAVRHPATWAVIREDPAMPAVTFEAPGTADGFAPRVSITAVDFGAGLDLVDFRNAGDGQSADCITDRQILSGEAHPTTPRWFPRIAGSLAGQTLTAFVVAYTGTGAVPAECAAARDTAPFALPLPHEDAGRAAGELAWLYAFVADREIEEFGSSGFVVTYVAPTDEFLEHLAQVAVIFESLIFIGTSPEGAGS